MGLDVVLSIVGLHVCFLGVLLSLQSFKVFLRLVPSVVQGQIEVAHVCAGSLNVFLYFIPDLLVLEKGVPNAGLRGREGMIHHCFLLFLFLIFGLELWLHY